MCAKVFCIMYENLWFLPRTSVNNLRANSRTQQPTHTHTLTRRTICICSWYLHLHLMCNYKLAVASAPTAVCLSCCLSLSLSLLLLSSCLPLWCLPPLSPPNLSPCSCFSCSWAKFALKWKTKQIYTFCRENLCSLYRFGYSQLNPLSVPLCLSLPPLVSHSLPIVAGVTT